MASGSAEPGRSAGAGPGKHPDLIPREFLRTIAVWSVIPLYAISGAFIGWIVDQWLGTTPYGIGVGLVIALIFAVRDLMRLRDEM